jgi:acyl-CoA thioester hydrolase
LARRNYLSDRRLYRHWSRDTVRFSDQDAGGHVNNVSVVAYFETGRLDFMHAIMPRVHAPPPRFVIARIAIDYVSESHWPGDVEIGCGILSVGTSSIRLGAAAFKDGACIATAEMTVVQLQGTTPLPLDPLTRQVLADYTIAAGPA